ncbi:hypothetical protein GCM10023223_34360 [Stackebrandtia albiflava]
MSYDGHGGRPRTGSRGRRDGRPPGVSTWQDPPVTGSAAVPPEPGDGSGVERGPRATANPAGRVARGDAFGRISMNRLQSVFSTVPVDRSGVSL